MEEKITLNLFYMGLISAILAAVLSGLVFFDAFRSQVAEDLQRQGKLIAVAYQQLGELECLDGMAEDELRVTLIDETGVVLYENATDPATMENHLNRPEVQEALEEGEGDAHRTSDTLGTEDYYYAVALQDGTVLRVSVSADNIYQIYGKAVPYLAAIVCGLMVLAVVFAVLLTRRLLIPIKKLPEYLDDPDLADDQSRVYPELKPFVTEIQTQRRDRDRIRREFTANVSHELKTPLTSISGYAEMIETGLARQEDVPRFAGTIRKEAARLLSLITDIIRLSQLEGEPDETASAPVELRALARECAEMLLPSAEKNGIQLTVSGDELHVMGQKVALWELVYNLMDNAIRYNRPGGFVEVTISGRKLTVSDTGIGISPEHQERIFERFYRVDKSHSRQTGGTGLGLSIVKHAAERHGAVISLDSTPGVGTAITAEFPEE